MFETTLEVEASDTALCADALVASIAEERQVVARRLARVAAWADLHAPETETPDLEGGRPRRRSSAGDSFVGGAEGTPEVSRAGLVELGMLLGVSSGSATALMRDVLELRHRLPAHWAAVQELEIDAWKARQVAKLTHGLTRDNARKVDTQVIEAVTGLPWGRAKDVVEAKVIAADPAAHAARLAEEENRRFVSTRRRSNAAGLRTVVARGHAGDIARLEAMITHLADRSQVAGNAAPADERRADAFAMLANPALACAVLADPQAGSASRDTELDSATAGDPEPPSAVELAVAFGKMLRDLGTKAIDRLRPRSVLYLHLAAEAVQGVPGCGVARVEDPLVGGPISTAQLKSWLANDRVTVKPVIDPTGIEPVDAHEIPMHVREAQRLLTPFETFPHGTLLSAQADLDHSKPYVPIDRGGPPGQTGIHNLGPLGRRHHLAKTFDRFTVHQLATGLYLWRSPTGHWCRVDHRGTSHLGRHAGSSRPAAIDTAERLKADGMSRVERRFRETILRHVAA